MLTADLIFCNALGYLSEITMLVIKKKPDKNRNDV